jgi:hypothetical protein
MVELRGYSPTSEKWAKSLGAAVDTGEGTFEVLYQCSSLPGMSGAPVYHKTKLVGLHIGHKPNGRTNVFLMLKAFETYLAPASPLVHESDAMRGRFFEDDVQRLVRRNAAVRQAINDERYDENDFDDEALARWRAVKDARDQGWVNDEVMHNLEEDYVDFIEWGIAPTAQNDLNNFLNQRMMHYMGYEANIPPTPKPSPAKSWSELSDSECEKDFQPGSPIT